MAVQRVVASGSGGVFSLGYHVVWCPKYRRAVLVDEVASRCVELIHAKAAERGWEVAALEVMPDHVHVFVKASPKDSPAFIANQLKGVTSRVLRAEFPHLRSLMSTLWSRSFFVATVGSVTESAVARYIETQWERPVRGAR